MRIVFIYLLLVFDIKSMHCTPALLYYLHSPHTLHWNSNGNIKIRGDQANGAFASFSDGAAAAVTATVVANAAPYFIYTSYWFVCEWVSYATTIITNAFLATEIQRCACLATRTRTHCVNRSYAESPFFAWVCLLNKQAMAQINRHYANEWCISKWNLFHNKCTLNAIYNERIRSACMCVKMRYAANIGIVQV